MKDNKTWKYIILVILAFALIMTVTMIVFISVKQRGKIADYTAEDSVIRVDEEWDIVDSDGIFVGKFTDFGKELDVNELHLSRMFVFPQDYRQDTLSFTVSFCAVQVYQDGFLV